jgi:hypothetical protein
MSGPVLAHGIGGRSDLPVPLWLALYGGAAAVLISFFALAAFWTESRLRGAEAGRPLPPAGQRIADAPATWTALRALGLAFAAAFVVVLALGPDDSSRNPAPTWFYVWFWVGLPPLSVLLGPVWRGLNPLRGLASAVRAVVGRWLPERDLPAALGYWPAAVSLLAFLWMELVYDHADTPHTVLTFVTGYGLVHLAGGVVYGQRWFDRGDGFEVYSTLFGHLAPVGRREDGRLVLRNPLDGLATLQPAPGLVATVAVLLGSTGFDGLTRSRFWRDLTMNLERPLYLVLGTAGLAAAIGFVLLSYAAATRLSRHLARPGRRLGIEARFVHSLLPIALGYTVAHYFSFAMFQGQAGYLLATDPLGYGWDLLGVAGQGVDYTAVGPQAIAFVQVGAIVIGHVVGVVAAHDRAMATFPRRHHRRGQYSLLVAMVAYTMGGIALVVGS